MGYRWLWRPRAEPNKGVKVTLKGCNLYLRHAAVNRLEPFDALSHHVEADVILPRDPPEAVKGLLFREDDKATTILDLISHDNIFVRHTGQFARSTL